MTIRRLFTAFSFAGTLCGQTLIQMSDPQFGMYLRACPNEEREITCRRALLGQGGREGNKQIGRLPVPWRCFEGANDDAIHDLVAHGRPAASEACPLTLTATEVSFAKCHASSSTWIT